MEGVAYPDLIFVWLEAMRGVFFLKTSLSLKDEEEGARRGEDDVEDETASKGRAGGAMDL